jgi:Tfp pilus assembly protein PilN
MIQVNLIPDVKAEFLKAQRTKRFVMGIAFIVSATFIALVVAMTLYVNVTQKTHSNNLTKDIAELSAQYQSSEDIAKIITIQKQLLALPELHENKPLISRVVTYLAVLTPEDVEFRSFDMSFENNQIIISGNGKTVPDVNVFANSIKNAIYTVGKDKENKLTPFNNVVLNTISSSEDGAVFELIFEFEPDIFTNGEDVTLTVPKIDSTSSEIERPKSESVKKRSTDLFDSGEESQ